MNRGQLVDHVSAESGSTTEQNEKASNELMDVIHTGLPSGGTVSLIGSGIFRVTDWKSRMARNPKTGEEMEVKARKIPVFKAGSNPRQAVNSR